MGVVTSKMNHTEAQPRFFEDIAKYRRLSVGATYLSSLSYSYDFYVYIAISPAFLFLYDLPVQNAICVRLELPKESPKPN